jgi:predicted adenylyl cyclase CyaB|tara:strand:+ start:465 stop:992 length:528 start_codon:yes stop_codon:yes gene_type:complete
MTTYNLETEVKIKISDEKLEEITSLMGSPDYFEQTNVIYAMPVGFLRLRKEKNKTIITYKGAPLDDRFHSRQEYESDLGLEQFPVLKDILGNIGLEETLSFTKKRAEFSLGHCKLFIDHIEGGIYFEIEAKYERDIPKAMSFFGLKEEDIEKRSYFQILQDYNSQKDLTKHLNNN